MFKKERPEGYNQPFPPYPPHGQRWDELLEKHKMKRQYWKEREDNVSDDK